MPIPRLLRRIALGAGAVVCVVAGAGLLFEALARSKASRRFPAPGTQVDIGGRGLHIHCLGSGSPTVVLEAGLDTFGSLSWALVQPDLALTTRTCAYDRAGIMWSDPADGPRDAMAIAEDLHEGLTRAGERGPFVLAGHSLGGPYVTVYAGRYPEEVAGIVYVDASHPDQQARFRAIVGDAMEPPRALMTFTPLLATTGVLRLMPMPGPPGLPDSLVARHRAFAPRSTPAMVAEARALPTSLARAGAMRDLGDRWLVVLTALRPLEDGAVPGVTRQQADQIQALWRTLHEEESRFSTRGHHVLVPDASHYIQFDRPDLVVAAVREVVDSVRRHWVTLAFQAQVP